MRKIINLIFFTICVASQSLINNSPILLNAQSEWSDDVRLTYFFGYSYDPRAVCNGDTVHLVWWEHYGVSGNLREEVFYKRSTDCGMTWGEDVRLSVEDDKTSVLPWIATYDNYVHVVWQQQDAGICYCKSIDGGNSWLLIDTIPNGGSGNPSICVAGSNVYVAAYRTDGKIIFSKSTDNGNTWWPSQKIDFNCASRPRIENLNSSQSSLILVCENLTSSVEIYFKKSSDAGTTWSKSQVISQYDSVSSQIPAVDVDDTSGVHITWYDYKYSPYPWTGDIFYRPSRNSGNTWEGIDSLTVIHRATASDVLSEGGNLHVVWEDDRYVFGENFEIYYRLSKDLGHTWEPELRLTDAPNWSRGPSLACDGKYLHLFWFDLRDDPSNIVGEIYYKRKDLSYSIEESDESAFVTNLRFTVHPNPFREILNVRWKMGDFSSTENVQRFTLKLFDVSGKEVMIYDLKHKIGGLKISTKHLPCGIYFVQVAAGEESGMKKVVKVE